ncbi:MAG TPA: flagellar motor switch protein FliM [Tepidisphaeraceae bacterium]|jgi:flagellar motor switch protein FliM|nr:flagellar motor switch protein FliM [Tepidisphaeraceae bacterium]
MADVLDQSEVDALLAAVDAGTMAQEPGVSSPAASMSHSSGGQYQRPDAQTYDFKRPERVSKDQMRALEALHEGFGRNFGAALSGYLRTIIEVSVAHIEQLTYSEFIHSLPNPTCFNLLKAEQLEGQLCLEISPLIIYPIIDRLLGGSNADLFIPQRPLTQIEQRLVQRITDRATHFLSEAWSNLTPVTFKVDDFESNPQLVQIVPPNETVVVIGFELKMGNRAGTMSLCIPYNVIEPIMGVLAAQNWFSYQRKGGQDDQSRKLKNNVHNAPVEVRAFLAQTSITMSDLLSLQVGDIITTQKEAGKDVLIQVEGKNKFLAQLGQFRGTKSIRITRKCQQTQDTLNPDTPHAPPSPAKAAAR